LRFKLMYIDRFNKMEEYIRQQQKISMPSYQIEDPVERAKVWIKEQEEKKQLQLEANTHKEKVLELQPKAEYTEVMLGSEDCLLVREYVKLLKNKGIDIGEKKMFQWLRLNGYLNHNNEPYAKYIKYFSVVESTYNNGYGATKIRLTSKISPEGQLYFYKKLLKHDYNYDYDGYCDYGDCDERFE
jgi:anti-repressor protein